MNETTLILSGYGLNCELETAHACQLASGKAPAIVHMSRLIEGRVALKNYGFVILVGGFLDGDDLGAGRIGANRWKCGQAGRLKDELTAFIESGKLVMGICNGFQVLVKMGVLPSGGRQQVSLTANANGRFQNSWVHLQAKSDSPCLLTKGIEKLELPVRHGEGRLEIPNATLTDIEQNHLVPLKYHAVNPNGSPLGIASLCNVQGNVLGLMPHPEAFTHYTHHPKWTRNRYEGKTGLSLFENAYQYLL